MYTKLKELLETNSSLTEFECDREIQIAAITILVDVGISNGKYTDVELGRAVDFSKSEFCLTDVEAGELLEIVRVLRTESEKVDKLIYLLRDSLTKEQTIKLLSIVWKIILADGHIDAMESEYAASIRRKLGLSLEQAVLAQQMAQNNHSKERH
jgi:uncharacterized tellurite resistance protein B-like protein